MSDFAPNAAPSRRADIQGLRAVAVLLVVLYHSDLWLDGGFVGVDVFFVISGFVITRVLTTDAVSPTRVQRAGRRHLVVEERRAHLRRRVDAGDP